jgi:hypothetical protein
MSHTGFIYDIFIAHRLEPHIGNVEFSFNQF